MPYYYESDKDNKTDECCAVVRSYKPRNAYRYFKLSAVVRLIFPGTRNENGILSSRAHITGK